MSRGLQVLLRNRIVHARYDGLVGRILKGEALSADALPDVDDACVASGSAIARRYPVRPPGD